eukprot:CAMPEP_0119302832 /NCGR_PEP_ID=MMETSP1333-20130426/4364_1 /TAXON_ID=418940 /ORGANISM="Scyphosphaera apsteinii, Strain RCC1455" /LENGTH=74 /DNA_ID=CAMNT_0007305309 /DNA_START=381 /DNA_END=605 /DNA_ORIENTATION=-
MTSLGSAFRFAMAASRSSGDIFLYSSAHLIISSYVGSPMTFSETTMIFLSATKSQDLVQALEVQMLSHGWVREW